MWSFWETIFNPELTDWYSNSMATGDTSSMALPHILWVIFWSRITRSMLLETVSFRSRECGISLASGVGLWMMLLPTQWGTSHSVIISLTPVMEHTSKMRGKIGECGWMAHRHLSWGTSYSMITWSMQRTLVYTSIKYIILETIWMMIRPSIWWIYPLTRTGLQQ